MVAMVRARKMSRAPCEPILTKVVVEVVRAKNLEEGTERKRGEERTAHNIHTYI